MQSPAHSTDLSILLADYQASRSEFESLIGVAYAGIAAILAGSAAAFAVATEFDFGEIMLVFPFLAIGLGLPGVGLHRYFVQLRYYMAYLERALNDMSEQKPLRWHCDFQELPVRPLGTLDGDPPIALVATAIVIGSVAVGIDWIANETDEALWIIAVSILMAVYLALWTCVMYLFLWDNRRRALTLKDELAKRTGAVSARVSPSQPGR